MRIVSFKDSPALILRQPELLTFEHGLNPRECGGVADELAEDPGVGGLAVVAVGEDDEGGLSVWLEPAEVLKKGPSPSETTLNVAICLASRGPSKAFRVLVFADGWVTSSRN